MFPDAGGDVVPRLAEAVRSAVRRCLGDSSEAAVAFSGGLDSSLLALLVHGEGRGLSLYTVGLPRARDLAQASKAASLLGLEESLLRIVVDEGEVLEAAGRLRGLFPDATDVEVAFALPLFLVCRRASQRLVLTGDGADELFGGYHRYLSMGPSVLEAALAADLQRLLSTTLPRHRLVARSLGHELGAPYTDDGVVALARAIPAGVNVAGGERKLALRTVAALLGLPAELCSAPKRAAQYGSGVARALERRRPAAERTGGGRPQSP